MQFTKIFNFKNLAFILFLNIALMCPIQANDNYAELDSMRADLSYIKDKSSPQYIKTKQKLEKFIIKNKIDYTNSARFVDVQRLIKEQKYNSAIWELNELIEQDYDLTRTYELLGDVYFKSAKPAKRVADIYKTSLQYDNQNTSVMFKLAKLYLREKRNIIAIEYLKQTIENTNDNQLLLELENIIRNKIMPNNRFEANNLYEALGKIYEKLDKTQEAYEAYAKAIQINQNDIFLRYHLADLLYKNNKNENAISIYNSILNIYPNDFQIKNSIAKSFSKKGDIESAKKTYLEILDKYPNSSQAKYGLYKIYESTLSPDKILKKLYSNNENYVVTSKQLRDFALFLADMGDVGAAKNMEQCAINIEEAQRQKILAQQEAQRQEQLRKEQLRQEQIKKENAKKEALEKEKMRQAQLKKEQERIAFEKKQKEQELLKQKKLKEEQLLKEKKEKEERLLQEKKAKEQQLLKEKKAKEEKLLQEKKAKQEALEKEKMRQAQLKKEQEQKALEKKAIELEKQKAIAKNAKKYQELKGVVDKYLAVNPKTTDIYIAISNTYKQMGEPTSALKYLKEAMKNDPTNSDIYYNIGLINFEKNDFAQAKVNLTKSINLDNENLKAKNLLAFVNQNIVTKIINDAYSKYEKKEYVSAFEILEKGLKQYPKHAQLYYYRALVYLDMNRNAAAIYDLQKAIELDPSHYMAYYHLGKAYEKIKDERNALAMYERFLSIEPQEQDLIKEIEQKVITLGSKYY